VEGTVFIWVFFGVADVQGILLAGIMAILLGLQLCWDSSYHKVISFSDSLQSVNFIRDGASIHHRFANEIHSIRSLLANEWDVVISHMLREGMRVLMLWRRWVLCLPHAW
jgi:hypothetical protein